ncbi:MAG TPA: hypothetical protein VGE15_06340 [Sphingobacteriaceae bacterium]
MPFTSHWRKLTPECRRMLLNTDLKLLMSIYGLLYLIPLTFTIRRTMILPAHRF